MGKFPLLVALTATVTPSLAFTAEDEIYGTYRLISTSQKVLETGEIVTLPTEQGFISYGRDGRMMALLTRGVRPKAESFDKMTAQDRIALFDSMTAYAGTYRFDGKTMEHHVDISWNEMWTGTIQFREITRDGERLIISTRPQPSPRDGRISITTLIWEKVK